MTWMSRLTGAAAALALSCLVAGPALAGGPSNPPPPAPKKWLPWIEGGGFLSTEQHRGESNLFAPLWQSSVALLFFQGSGKYFEDDIQEGNFDIGFRKMHRSGWNFGLWGGYDVRNTEEDNTFHQISFGVEALSDRWDVRANGYVAVSDPESSPGLARVFVTGNNIFLTGAEEVPLSGVDGEVGYKVFSRRGGMSGGMKDGPARHGRSHELRVFAGGFYFDDSDALEEVAGPRARVEWRVDDVVRWLPGSRLTFEGEYQHDDVREDQWEGGVRFRVPFGGGGQDARATLLASLTPQERRMTESIVRDTDIVTAASEEENVFDILTGVRFDRVAAVGSGGDISATSTTVGNNSLIIVNGTVTGAQVLQGNQTLQGGSSTIQVQGTRSGLVVPFTAPGAPGFVQNTANSAVIAITNNNHVAGLNISGAGQNSGLGLNDGIFGDGPLGNVAVTGNTITNVGFRGVNLAYRGATISNTTIHYNAISTIGESGIFNETFDTANLNLTVHGNTVAGLRNVTATEEGIVNRSNDQSTFTATIKNNTINLGDLGSDGILNVFGGNSVNRVDIHGNTINNANNDGIEFTLNNDSQTFATVTNNIINNADDESFEIDTNQNARAEITISNNTFVSPDGDDGLEVDTNNNSVLQLTVTNNIFTGQTDGINLDADGASTLIATISNNDVTADQSAFEADLDDTATTRVSIVNNTLRSINGNPIDIDADDQSQSSFQIANNVINSADPTDLVFIRTFTNAALNLQIRNNTTNVSFDFDENGASIFQLEDTIATNTFLGGAVAVIDAGIAIVPAGTFFPLVP